jgi:tRNA(Ile)-lysidine synthase
MDLLSLQTILSKTCALHKEKPLVVGVSGGPDSLCLLHLLHTCGYSVLAVHVNHQLRAEADREEDVVREFATNLNVSFIHTRVDVHRFAADQKLSIEESARILRYRFLMDVAEQHQAQAVAVAHQADDQIETVLMHLLRGSGLAGLRGMPYRGTLPVFSKTIPVVRPLLGVWREEIVEYCAQNGITPCFDASNADSRYFRNRIRKELIPLLKTYNDQAPQHLWQLANLVGAEEELLQEQALTEFNQVTSQHAEGVILFRYAGYQDLPLALQRRLLRMAMAELQENLRDIGAEAVQRAEEFLSREKLSGTCQLLDGVWLSRFDETQIAIYRSGATFEQVCPVLRSQQPIPLTLPGITPINAFWQLSTEWVASKTMDFQREVWTIYLDADALKDLRVTKADTSERFSFLSQGDKRIKVGDLFTDKKVFLPARSSWPVLRSGDQILWVPGLKRSSQALVTQQTKRILHLTLKKMDPTE